MKINSKQALALLKVAQAVIVDGSPVINSWCHSEVKGEPDNEVLFFQWDDGKEEYVVKFTEEGLDNAKFVDGEILADDSEGEPSRIQLFVLERVSWDMLIGD